MKQSPTPKLDYFHPSSEGKPPLSFAGCGLLAFVVALFQSLWIGVAVVASLVNAPATSGQWFMFAVLALLPGFLAAPAALAALLTVKDPAQRMDRVLASISLVIISICALLTAAMMII